MQSCRQEQEQRLSASHSTASTQLQGHTTNCHCQQSRFMNPVMLNQQPDAKPGHHRGHPVSGSLIPTPSLMSAASSANGWLPPSARLPAALDSHVAGPATPLFAQLLLAHITLPLHHRMGCWSTSAW
jgi:hypothetical protein